MTDTHAWRGLLGRFLAGRMNAPAFETAFLDRWRHERDSGLRSPFAIDTLFYEVDAYCADPALRGPHDIDADALKAAARKALDDIDRPWPELPGAAADAERLDAVRRAAGDLFGRSFRNVR